MSICASAHPTPTTMATQEGRCSEADDNARVININDAPDAPVLSQSGTDLSTAGPAEDRVDNGRRPR